MLRIIAALFLCLAFAPLARAQSLDCANAIGLMQRVCEAPELIPLEEERRQLIGELQFIDPAHPEIQNEAAWIASQDSCADAGCLSAAYLNHNQSLRMTIEAAAPPPESGEALPVPEPQAEPAPERTSRGDASSGSRLDEGPAVRPNEYLVTIIVMIVTLLIALWLLSAAARARRAERGEG